jgi:hypothetical protein
MDQRIMVALAEAVMGVMMLVLLQRLEQPTLAGVVVEEVETSQPGEAVAPA